MNTSTYGFIYCCFFICLFPIHIPLSIYIHIFILCVRVYKHCISTYGPSLNSVDICCAWGVCGVTHVKYGFVLCLF